jgi:outer membrane protein OmpU
MNKLHKKILLGSTALVGAAMFASAAQAVTVTTGGFARFQAGFFDDDFRHTTDREFQMESEIHVRAKGTAENGMEYGATVQLKASTDDSFAADEVTLWVESKWGRVELGDQDGAADVMSYYAPKIGFGQAVDADYDDWLDGSSKPAIGPKALDSDDATKITYFTPRFAGMQVGLSYAPELDNGENILRDSRSDLALASNTAATAQSGNLAATNRELLDHVMPAVSTAGAANASRGDANRFFKRSFEDFIEVGANYVTKFDDVSIAVAAGYSHAEQKSVPDTADDRHPINAWHVGAQFGWMGWKLGGSFVENDKSGQLKNHAVKKTEDRNAWNLGLSYENGPWGVGVNYLSEDYGGRTKGSGEYHALGLGAQYHLAPGMMVAADFVTFKRKFGESGTTTQILPGDGGVSLLKPGKTEDSGHVFIIGSQLDF